MHIVLVGNPAFDSLEFHLADACCALGHTAEIIDTAGTLPLLRKLTYWAGRFVAPYDRSRMQQLASRIARRQPDLVLVVYRHLHPALTDALRQQCPGAVLAQINPDHVANLENQQILAADFDHYFTKEPYMAAFMRDKAGLNAHYLPEAFNPRVHRRPAGTKADAERITDIDVLVFGGLYAYRARMVEQLQRAGLRVTLYAQPGPYLKPALRSTFQPRYLVGPEKNRQLYGARIVFNNFHYAEISSANQKYFEINGIGGFQLCDHKDTLDSYSAVPAEQVTFRSMAEAIDLIRYYLARPDERHALAEQQYAHFQAHHTVDQRMAQLLAITHPQLATQ
ncbi:hypothetical protein GCM10027578_31890 [Spirosoma luteolum]